MRAPRTRTWPGLVRYRFATPTDPGCGGSPERRLLIGIGPSKPPCEAGQSRTEAGIYPPSYAPVRRDTPASAADELLTATPEASPWFTGHWPLTCYDTGGGGRI